MHASSLLHESFGERVAVPSLIASIIAMTVPRSTPSFVSMRGSVSGGPGVHGQQDSVWGYKTMI